MDEAVQWQKDLMKIETRCLETLHLTEPKTEMKAEVKTAWAPFEVIQYFLKKIGILYKKVHIGKNAGTSDLKRAFGKKLECEKFVYDK